MFDLLKKKIGSFADKLTGKLEEKQPEESVENREEPAVAVEEKEEELSIPEDEYVEASAGEERAPEEKLKEVRGEEGKELKAKVSVKSRITGFISGEIKIDEKDLSDFLDEFELSLLEADVEQETAVELIAELKSQLVGKKVPRGKDITAFLKEEIKKVLSSMISTEEIDFFGMAGKKKPFVVMFLGPNGAGKTTSIAKIVHAIKERNMSCILAAADTFRAASIEQIEVHAEKLGVRVVKHQYGADPAAVAFDAVKAAEARKIDFVLIDSAGRQETNKNLMEELKKIERVAKPDLKLYVGEAFTGQALLNQATEFDKHLGLDGFVLTKIDTDTKGGTAISLLYKLKKPIVFIGTGQRYEDLVEFKPEYILDRVIS
ncbi:MAG: signal recognition particle-docking protein FtsY [Candidatus Diapherotrites archaeon]